MSRLKTIFALLVVVAIAGIVPQAHATVTIEVVAAGSSAQWQSMAIGAYNALIPTATKPVGHWTSVSNTMSLVDNRHGINNTDPGTVWVVWQCTSATCTSASVWMFDKVDSVIGDRCFFANPACTLLGSSSVVTTSGANKIQHYLFKDGSLDTTMPAILQNLLEQGTAIGVAATDIRPEDAMFAMCRANSAAGSNTSGANTTDGLDGLGYNPNNAAGVCPTTPGTGNVNAVGTPITSGIPGSSAAAANTVAFSVVPGAADPISGSPVKPWTVVNVGAAPIVIVKGSMNSLAGLHNASPTQLAQVFSGTNCDASAFSGSNGAALPTGGINIFLREPTSGTMNTTEATLFRGPTVSPNNGTATAPLGLSQETNVYNTTTLTLNNPLAGQNGTCNGNAASARYRGLSTSDVVNSGVQNSNNGSIAHPFPNLQDGIAYTFFGFGNVAGLNDSPNFGYITINGVDPIFATYNSTSSRGFDPAQPPSGELPGQPDLELPALACVGGTGQGYPCAENQIWAGGLSFPNVRNGSYPAWSLLRAIALTSGGQLTALKALVLNSQKNVVSTVPDYIPYAAVTCPRASTSTPWFVCPVGGGTDGVKDPGLLVLRAHYLQTDGGGTAINTGTVENFTKTGSGGYTEAGGDMGGEVFVCPTAQADCPNQAGITFSATGVYLPQSQQVIGGLGVITSSTVGGYSGGFTIRP